MDIAMAEGGQPESHLPIAFTGKGGEYFGIWIVNLLLTVLTLGIYSAWAKVRRLQYFYRNTTLAESSFDYHGSPTAILKGRLIAFAMLLIYNLAGSFNPFLGLMIGALFACSLPWLLLRSLQFRLHNSSHRGLRFRFRGTLGESYVVFLLLPMAVFVTVYLLAPVWHQQLKRFQHNNSWYGQTAFSFDAPIRTFYKIYLAAAGLFLGGAVLVVLLLSMFAGSLLQTAGRSDRGAFIAIVMLFLAGLVLIGLFIKPYFDARLQNLVWSNTRLGPHRFVSRVSAYRLFFIMITNLIGLVLTLGLFRPFAVVRLLKYRLESVSVVASGDFDSFAASQEQPVAAVGEEAAEMFDIDIGL